MANIVSDFVYDPDALDYEYDDSEIPLIHPDNSKEFLAKLIDARICIERYNAKVQKTSKKKTQDEPYSLNYLLGEWAKMNDSVPPLLPTAFTFDTNLMTIDESGSSVDSQLRANPESRIVFETNAKDTEGRVHFNNNESGNGNYNDIETFCALPTSVNKEISNEAAKGQCFNCATDCNVDMDKISEVMNTDGDSGYHSEASAEISDEDGTPSCKSDMELDDHYVCKKDCSTISINSAKEFQEDEFTGMPTLEIAMPVDRVCGGDEDTPPILLRYIY